MSNDACVLTSKDFTILELMLDRCLGRDDPLRSLLVRKLDLAEVVFSEDMPEDIATLNSRIKYCVNNGMEQSRILTRDRQAGPVGLMLPISTPRGLALLGLRVGQSIVLSHEGGNDDLELQDVLYQPEAAKRYGGPAATVPVVRPQPVLRLIQGSGGPKMAHSALQHDGSDDPGPSAA